jgi:hypothetical protein
LLCLALALAGASAARAEPSGSFSSSDPLLNEIWGASVRTASDMISPPVRLDKRRCKIALPRIILDGTVRDRCPYIGDEAVIGPALDVSRPRWAVQRNMLAWFAAAQHAGGAIPASALFDHSLVLIDYNAYWVQALHTYVLYSGDTAVARQVRPQLVELLDRYYPAHMQNGLLVNDPPLGDYGYFPRRGTVVAYYNAQYALALELAAKLATWVGDPRHARTWRARRQRLAQVFASSFWDEDKGAFKDTTTDSQTHPQDAQAFAILAGLATSHQASAALAYLDAHNVRGYGNTVTDSDAWDGAAVGHDIKGRAYPFSSYFEVLARYAAGDDRGALNLIRREWGYMVKNGPRSTMWETIGPNGGGPTDQHPSWDAGWSSGAAPALTSYVLGVQPTSPGYATFTVTPHRGDLGWAAGSVVTPHGRLRVSWRYDAKGFPVLRVHAPPGTRWTNPP